MRRLGEGGPSPTPSRWGVQSFAALREVDDRVEGAIMLHTRTDGFWWVWKDFSWGPTDALGPYRASQQSTNLSA